MARAVFLAIEIKRVVRTAREQDKSQESVVRVSGKRVAVVSHGQHRILVTTWVQPPRPASLGDVWRVVSDPNSGGRSSSGDRPNIRTIIGAQGWVLNDAPCVWL